ncbi:MAG: glycoside hydrolase family 3 N-terminal domain-containing protein [Bacilli bacterium]
MNKQALKQLLKELSIDEKVGQLNMLGGSIYSEFSPERQSELLLKGQIGSMMFFDPKINNELQKKNLALSAHAIPILFCGDMLHGLRTIFPCPLGEDAAFDPALAEETNRFMALEGCALGAKWAFGPMCDIARDARWGRNIEGGGEDVYLAEEMSKAKVRGLQGKGKIDQNHMAATVKHFGGYSFLEEGCEYERVIASRYELETYAFPVYEAAIKEGALAVMSAFSDVEGVPCTANKALINDLLRKKWGFKGVVVSDYAAVAQLQSSHYVASAKEAVYESFKAGNDIDMESRLYVKYLPELVKEDRISEKELDAAVLRVLELKNKLGLFEHPYADETREGKALLTPAALAQAKKEALRSAVLLKNNGVLPLNPNSIISAEGPYFDSAIGQNGPWSYDNSLDHSITYKQALTRDFPLLKEGKGAEIVLYFAGIERDKAGEAASLSNLDLPLEQKEEIRSLIKAGKQVVLILTSARVLSLSEEEENCGAILDMWAPGIEGGEALSELLSGKEEPTGHTAMSFPRTASACPTYFNGFSSPRPNDDNNYFTTKWRDLPYGALYPFGYGLYYYPSKLLSLSVVAAKVALKEQIQLKVGIVNLSAKPVRRLIQIYGHKRSSMPLRPAKELYGFAWCELEPHETKEVGLAIPASRLAKTKDGIGFYVLSLGENSRDFSAEIMVEIGK